MNAHTPGPWVANSHRDGSRIEADGRSVAWVGADTLTTNETEVMSGQAKADARLIAAAPELLAALEKLVPLGDLGVRADVLSVLKVAERRSFDAGIALARAAIAKARGGK